MKKTDKKFFREWDSFIESTLPQAQQQEPKPENRHGLAAKLYAVAARNIVAAFCTLPFIGLAIVAVHATGQHLWLERMLSGISGLMHGFGFGMLALAWFAEQQMEGGE